MATFAPWLTAREAKAVTVRAAATRPLLAAICVNNKEKDTACRAPPTKSVTPQGAVVIGCAGRVVLGVEQQGLVHLIDFVLHWQDSVAVTEWAMPFKLAICAVICVENVSGHPVLDYICAVWM